MKLLSVLSIAGSDSSGGAGIQADIKTIQAHRMFAQTAITALTAQNTLGVSGVFPVDPDFITAQIDAVFQDIRPDAVKVGMIPTPEAACAVAEALRCHKACNIVVDPVMVATSGSALSTDASVQALTEHLLPLADIITPNMAEGQVLSGRAIKNFGDAVEAVAAIRRRYGTAVLLKGGHALSDKPHAADDLLCQSDGMLCIIEGHRVDNPNAHGTGCTLSSAIACGLAAGCSVEQAVRCAKGYITGALQAGLDLGGGSGPLDHDWRRNSAIALGQPL